MRNTAQRLEIKKLLNGDKSHPTAAEIYARLKKKFPTVSFATVYNNLEKMADAGEILIVNADPQRKRFDPCVKPHGHILCETCGRVYDFSASVNKPSIKGFKVLSFCLQARAVCPACIKKGNKTRRKKWNRKK
ncbi:MAG: Fur family transcriptional regulator [Elusimicrobiota bacterium]